jgi:hypothetical protein
MGDSEASEGGKGGERRGGGRFPGEGVARATERDDARSPQPKKYNNQLSDPTGRMR